MNASNPLDEFALKHGTGKSSAEYHYTDPYYRLFAPLRERELTLLEIGVSSGASLRMWEAFFSHARIFGIDEDPACRAHESARVRIFIGDQSDARFLREVVRETGSLDIVIDDGSHHPDHQLASLTALFPHLTDDGIYVIEDLACCFSARFGAHAGLGNPGSTIEYLKSLLDILHADPRFGGRQGDEIASRIRAIHLHPQIAFLFKGAPRFGNGLHDGVDRRTRPRGAPDGAPDGRVRSLRGRLRAAGFHVRKFARRFSKKTAAWLLGRSEG